MGGRAERCRAGPSARRRTGSKRPAASQPLPTVRAIRRREGSSEDPGDSPPLLIHGLNVPCRGQAMRVLGAPYMDCGRWTSCPARGECEGIGIALVGTGVSTSNHIVTADR
nr:unnamed protein product [Leishmania braziliensis]